MFRTLREKRAPYFAKKLPPRTKPTQIDWQSGGSPAVISFSDGTQSLGSCIRCYDSPCIDYSPDELALTVFKDFPVDRNSNVCPTSAISWAQNNEFPDIDKKACIMCGLCVSRCPVGAIYLNNNGAHVNDKPNEHFVIQPESSNSTDTKKIAELFKTINKKGIYLAESDILLEKFRRKIEMVNQTQGQQFPNHLARNLLIATGIGAAMRRRGDVYLRMDLLLGPPGVKLGTGEVELGAEILAAPRNILDDIAVLVARYELTKEDIVPLIVSLDLPNLRSEYWQFIKDVREVLNLKINSITIGALAILIWNRAKLKITTGEELYIDIDTPSLRPKIESILKHPLNVSGAGYPGFLESGK